MSANQFQAVLSKKKVERELVQKKFNQALSKLVTSDQKLKPELMLRILRSLRLKLCHEYCSNVTKEVWKDSVKIQLLDTCN